MQGDQLVNEMQGNIRTKFRCLRAFETNRLLAKYFAPSFPALFPFKIRFRSVLFWHNPSERCFIPGELAEFPDKCSVCKDVLQMRICFKYSNPAAEIQFPDRSNTFRDTLTLRASHKKDIPVFPILLNDKSRHTREVFDCKNNDTIFAPSSRILLKPNFNDCNTNLSMP